MPGSGIKLVIGMKVRYLAQPEWGVGHLAVFHDNGTKAEVLFPTREDGPILVSTKGGALVPAPLRVGDRVKTSKGQLAVLTEEVEGGRGLRRYVMRYEDATEDELPESELRALAPKPDLLSMLREGRVGDARSFLLRKSALLLDEERRCDALGALLSSRVMVKPHQVGVVQRVLSSRRPRFVLADEVGLGKTIEAGMIFSALRLSGLANRVLVVAPSHLTVQWLGELFHKFNQLFTLMDGERFAQAQEERPDISPWARFDKVVTSLELLSRSAEHRQATGAPAAAWDLVIIDEAHHLKGEKAFEAAKALAQNSWGLLLLTATPMQLDPAEYHSLLQLIDPATAPSLKGFEALLARQEEVSTAVRGLLESGHSQSEAAKAISALAQKFPDDAKLKTLDNREALLTHLAETYSLSDRLIRNRRAVVGGFAQRKLRRHKVTLPEPELQARSAALEAVRTHGQLRGAALASLLRRLESSPAAFTEAVSSQKALAAVLSGLRLPPKDTKFNAFRQVLAGIWEKEKAAKILVFTEARATLESLRQLLQQEGIEALVYHGELSLVDRDRQVARFRDPEGPKVLICTEVGGEGRNFQFSHHLVNYDLPWSPATMEQRIGRLDRIGQTQAVEIHVFDLPGTLSADVLSLLADAVGVFGETVGGLDAVLEEVEPTLTELALTSPEERASYAKALKERVEKARDHVRRAYDPLLDLRSFDREQVEALVRRAQGRMGLNEDDDEDDEEAEPKSLEDGLWAVSRDLDERLEETVTDLARKVGIGVDTDEQVEAFQCAFHFGHALNVDALPGLSIHEEKTVLGSFWRDSAVEQEEIEFFATGHPIIEALFGFLRDGPHGRNSVRFLEKRGPLKAKGLEVMFHVVPQEPADTTIGARVPSRQLSRFIDRWLLHTVAVETPSGKPKSEPSLLSALEKEGRTLKGHEVTQAFPGFAEFVDPAVAVATQAAQEELALLQKRAYQLIETERDTVLNRMRLSLGHQGLPQATIDAQVEAEKAFYETLVEALKGLRVELDSASGFILNR